MLKGIDISHHNKYQYQHNEFSMDDYDFIIMKATEGRTYVDPMMDEYMKEIVAKEKKYGFYHFARPENNDPISEAKHFCDTIGTDGVGAILALDWESKAISYDLDWALDWLRYVERVYNKKPLFYCSASFTSKLNPIYQNGNGLWVAHYTKADKPRVKAYPFYAIWQYTDSPLDKDVFNGNEEQWYKYT